MHIEDKDKEVCLRLLVILIVDILNCIRLDLSLPLLLLNQLGLSLLLT